jgi:hypothetical protein
MGNDLATCKLRIPSPRLEDYSHFPLRQTACPSKGEAVETQESQ